MEDELNHQDTPPGIGCQACEGKEDKFSLKLMHVTSILKTLTPNQAEGNRVLYIFQFSIVSKHGVFPTEN